MPDGMETKKDIVFTPEAVSNRWTGKRVHLIGIGGSGMRALAGMLVDCGAVVTGSDQSAGGIADRIAKLGIAVAIGQKPDNIPVACDLVVYSAAIAAQNPELLGARERGLEVLKYSQMIGRLMDDRMGVAIAGTHGKSTTTGMVSYVLNAAGMCPSFIVGATVPQLGGPSGAGSGKHFVVEACEFDRSFLNYRPHLATILNIDEDHLDCYQDLDAIVEAFRAFASQVDPGGVLIAHGEDRDVAKAVAGARCEVETFGLADDCTWRATNLAPQKGRYQVNILYNNRPFATLAVPLPGLHNVYNSLAAVAILYHSGVEASKIAQLLGQFTGTYRRMTLKGQVGGVTVVDDYAHHPTEIQTTLRAIREYYEPKRLFCIFQPHQHSRTRFLLKDFARSFGECHEVILPDIYFVRDSALEKDYISSQDLVAQIRLNGGHAIYLKTFDDILEHLKSQLQAGDLLVTMGAGNIWEVADETVRWLGTNRSN